MLLAARIEITTEISSGLAEAEELAAAGENAEAEQLLAIQVARLLRYAGRGGRVSDELREEVCRFALELAHQTASVLWLDWVIELHLITDAPLTPELVTALEGSKSLLSRADGELLSQYLETLQQRHRSLSDDALELVSHLRELRGAK